MLDRDHNGGGLDGFVVLVVVEGDLSLAVRADTSNRPLGTGLIEAATNSVGDDQRGR